MSALTTLETDLDCLESKKKKRRGLFVSIFVAFRERESSRTDIVGCNEMSHPPSLPIFFCLGCCSSSFLSLSLKSIKERRKRRRDRHTHKKKEREMKISAFFPLEKYLPLISRGKSKIKTKSDEMPRVCAFLSHTHKKNNHHPLSLSRDRFSLRARKDVSNQHSRTIVRSKVEKIERRNFASGVNFVF
jgi:hypothetical protein